MEQGTGRKAYDPPPMNSGHVDLWWYTGSWQPQPHDHAVCIHACMHAWSGNFEQPQCVDGDKGTDAERT